MKRIIIFIFLIGCVVGGFMLILSKRAGVNVSKSNVKAYGDTDEESEEKAEREGDEAKAAFVKARLQYEYDLLKDVATGKIPYGIHEKELAVARTLPAKQFPLSGILGMENLNTYIPAGPTNIGGRTRAITYDRRFNNTTNRVIIAGCVSGGILRSADGGSSWTRVSPENDIHTLSALAQDPRPGFENTWYAGGGEPYSSSADAPGAPYLENKGFKV